MRIALSTVALLLAASAAAQEPSSLRINDVAVIGTHNSYKLAMPADTMVKVRAANPAMADALDYAHRRWPSSSTRAHGSWKSTSITIRRADAMRGGRPIPNCFDRGSRCCTSQASTTAQAVSC
jgi:hypothetical protein